MPDLTAGRDCEVVSRCGWGCASANLEVDPKAHAAKWDPAESPFGRSDWIPFTARGSDTAGQDVEVTLHVCAGYLQELEIWTGEYGDFSIPEPETLMFGVELASTKLGSIKTTSCDSEPGEVHGFGGLETTAERLLDSVEWRLSESLGTDWLPCRPGDNDEACSCSEAHAEMADDELRVWYGDRDHPSLSLPPVSLQELEGLASRWSAQFAEEE